LFVLAAKARNHYKEGQVLPEVPEVVRGILFVSDVVTVRIEEPESPCEKELDPDERVTEP
jgi:hypothetical protein